MCLAGVAGIGSPEIRRRRRTCLHQSDVDYFEALSRAAEAELRLTGLGPGMTRRFRAFHLTSGHKICQNDVRL